MSIESKTINIKNHDKTKVQFVEFKSFSFVNGENVHPVTTVFNGNRCLLPLLLPVFKKLAKIRRYTLKKIKEHLPEVAYKQIF